LIVLEVFPLVFLLDALVSSLSDISSNLCPSIVAEDSELVSPDAPAISFRDPNLDRHFDLPFSGACNNGTVRPLDGGTGSKETLETECPNLVWLGVGLPTVAGENGWGNFSESDLCGSLVAVSLEEKASGISTFDKSDI
jgi:hypothetical protein